MKRYSYEISYYSVNNQLDFEIASLNEDIIIEFVNLLLKIYLRENESSGLSIDVYQIHTKKHHIAINEVLDQYKANIPEVNRLIAFFRNLEIGESFAFLPGIKLDQKDKIKLRNYLEAKGDIEDFEKKNEQFNELFDELLNDYSVMAFGEVRQIIGQGNKRLRICRFCKNGQPTVTFKSKAHAISEGLGNKKVILNEECDKCNDKFSESIEPELIEYLALFRTMYGVQAKGGDKKYIGSNFELFREDGNIHLISKEKGTADFENKKENKIPLKSFKEISLQNIYRCLCKYFISVISSEKLKFFENTIEWINGEFDIDFLPKVAHLTSYHSFTLEPRLTCYLRTSTDKSIPFAVCEFQFTCRTIVFVIPVCSEDKIDFVKKTDYNMFWKKFKHYDLINGWEFHDLSLIEKKKFVFNLNIMNNGFLK